MPLAIGLRVFVDACESKGHSPLDVIEKFLQYNNGVYSRYTVGLDSEHMKGKDGAKRPHYHLHMVTVDTWSTGREITQKSYLKFREKFPVKLGRDLEVKIALWDGDEKFLAYAVKEKFIRANFDITDSFRESMMSCLATKIAEMKKINEDEAKKEHNKAQKDSVLEYIQENYDRCANALSSSRSDYNYGRYSYSRDNPSPDSFRTIYIENRTIRLCIEDYQNIKDKTFRRFDIDNYVLTYFRKGLKKTPLEMLDVRDALGI